MARAEDIVKAGSGAVLVWHFLPDDASPSTFIHRCFSREGWRESGLQQRLELCAGVLAWPFLMPAVIGVFTWFNGSWVKQKTGKGIARQMGEQLMLAARHSLLPPWYYIFELYEDEKRRRAGEYLQRFETKRFLYPFLRKYNGGLPVPAERSTVCLSDKALFADRCGAHGLPAVPPIMVIEDGRVVRSAGDTATLPEIDLFVKMLRGTGGRGAERWEFQSGRGYCDNTGRVFCAAELIEHLKALTVAKQRGCIVLARLVNHPEMSDLTNGALATVRAVTCRNERGEFEATNASLRMAQGRTSVVDNFHAGGIVAKVDLSTGEVGPATDGAMALGPGRGWCEHHPDTGGQIVGRRLPYWRETLELACRAHTLAFPDHVVIGWDIGILADGPCLIEGNKGPDLDLVQKSHREPLGNAPGELAHLGASRRAVPRLRSRGACPRSHRRLSAAQPTQAAAGAATRAATTDLASRRVVPRLRSRGACPRPHRRLSATRPTQSAVGAATGAATTRTSHRRASSLRSRGLVPAATGVCSVTMGSWSRTTRRRLARSRWGEAR
jgi:hypothetical protein